MKVKKFEYTNENIKDIIKHPREELENKIHDLITFLSKYKKVIKKEISDEVIHQLNILTSTVNKIPKHELYAMESLDENILNSLYDKLKSEFSNFIKQESKQSFILPMESKELFLIIKKTVIDKYNDIKQDLEIREKGKNLEIYHITN